MKYGHALAHALGSTETTHITMILFFSSEPFLEKEEPEKFFVSFRAGNESFLESIER